MQEFAVLIEPFIPVIFSVGGIFLLLVVVGHIILFVHLITTRTILVKFEKSLFGGGTLLGIIVFGVGLIPYITADPEDATARIFLTSVLAAALYLVVSGFVATAKIKALEKRDAPQQEAETDQGE